MSQSVPTPQPTPDALEPARRPLSLGWWILGVCALGLGLFCGVVMAAAALR